MKYLVCRSLPFILQTSIIPLDSMKLSFILLTLPIHFGNGQTPSPSPPYDFCSQRLDDRSADYACNSNDTELFSLDFCEEEPTYGPSESCISCITGPFVGQEVGGALPVDDYPGVCFAPSVYEENESCPANATGALLLSGLNPDTVPDILLSTLSLDCITCLIPGLAFNLQYLVGLASQDPPLINQTRISSTAPCTPPPVPGSCTLADSNLVQACTQENVYNCFFAGNISAGCQNCLVSMVWYSGYLVPEDQRDSVAESLFISSCYFGEAWPSDVGPPSSAPTMAPSMVPAPSAKSPTTKAPSPSTSAGAKLITGGIVTTVAAFFALAT